jgi:putative thioredoxin
MSSQENPYGGFGAQQVQFGSAAPKAGRAAAPGESLGAGPAAAFVKDTTTASFTADVIQESRRQPVLVDFWAPWCGPCKQLTPLLERAVANAGGAVRLVKMNIDEHPAIAGQLGIQSIPAVIAFKDGRPVDGFMGAVLESQIRDFIKRVGGSAGAAGRLEEAIAAAGEAAALGDWSTAAEIYSAVLQAASDNIEALAGLAGALFESGDTAQAKQILASVPEENQQHSAVVRLRAKMALAEQTAELGDADDLVRRVQADPNDFQARFDLAMLQNARGQRHDAADNLLALVKADRSWKDDAARKQLLQLFEAWGMADEATLAARRRLSSLLFS